MHFPDGKPAALVLDAHLKSALAAIRSLGKKGIRVLAGADRPTAMGLYSNYVHRGFLYPSPFRSRDRFVEYILRLASSNPRPLVLYTFSDATFLALYESRRQGTNLLAIYPESDRAVWNVFDKHETLRIAREAGIEIPQTWFDQQITYSCSDSLEWQGPYPLVVKPRRSTIWRNGAAAQVAPRLAFTRDEARMAFHELIESTGEIPMIQEYAGGEEMGAEFMCSEGAVIAEFAHRRIRSLSPLGGASVVKQAVPTDYNGICEIGRRLVQYLRWNGPVMVEFKVDHRDRKPKLIEVNGRFWGSLPLAVLAGVDFPWIYFCLATGTTPPRANRYRDGVISRHWLGDLGHLCRVLFRDDPMRRLAYPSRWSAIREFSRSVCGTRSDIWALDDPIPGIAELSDAAWRVAKRLVPVPKKATPPCEA